MRFRAWSPHRNTRGTRAKRFSGDIADMGFVPQLHPGDQLPVSDALSRLSKPQINAVTGQLTIKQLNDEQERDPLILSQDEKIDLH